MSRFSTTNLGYVLEINIFGRDFSNLRYLKDTWKSVVWLQVVANGHQNTKTTEDEEVYILNKWQSN